MTMERAEGEINNVSVRRCSTFNECIFCVCGRQKLLRETDEAGGEITRLDGYHEGVLLLFKFIFILDLYSAFSFCAREKKQRE